jgi:hypothetical protein
MKRLAINFVSAAVALVVAGTAKAAYVEETASIASAVPARVVGGDIASQFFQSDSSVGFSTQLELSLVETQHDAIFQSYETNLQPSPFGPGGPSRLPEFPTILAALLLLVPLGVSTLRILTKRSTASLDGV